MEKSIVQQFWSLISKHEYIFILSEFWKEIENKHQYLTLKFDLVGLLPSSMNVFFTDVEFLDLQLLNQVEAIKSFIKISTMSDASFQMIKVFIYLFIYLFIFLMLFLFFSFK
jgi:hypothetical protein